MNLTTLAAVKAFALSNVPTATQSGADDALLNSLIRQVSNAVMNYLGRPFPAKAQFTEAHNGTGGVYMMLRQWPVVGVTTVAINGQPVLPVQTPGGAGYVLEGASPSYTGKPQAVYLNSYCYEYGVQNVVFTYNAGYCIANEPWTIPATPYQVTPLQPQGNWCQDDGVTYATGTPLVKVPSGPTQGQYTVSASGVYTFNSADNGQSILISYSFVPADIEQACIEAVTERYRYKNRVGQKSLGAANQTTAFDNDGITSYTKMILNPYRRAFPL